MIVNQAEENALTKLMLDSFQQKQREVEMQLSTFSRMQGVPAEHYQQDNQYIIH
jgi:hypothetical protein